MTFIKEINLGALKTLLCAPEGHIVFSLKFEEIFTSKRKLKVVAYGDVPLTQFPNAPCYDVSFSTDWEAIKGSQEVPKHDS